MQFRIIVPRMFYQSSDYDYSNSTIVCYLHLDIFSNIYWILFVIIFYSFFLISNDLKNVYKEYNISVSDQLDFHDTVEMGVLESLSRLKKRMKKVLLDKESDPWKVHKDFHRGPRKCMVSSTFLVPPAVKRKPRISFLSGRQRITKSHHRTETAVVTSVPTEYQCQTLVVMYIRGSKTDANLFRNSKRPS